MMRDTRLVYDHSSLRADPWPSLSLGSALTLQTAPQGNNPFPPLVAARLGTRARKLSLPLPPSHDLSDRLFLFLPFSLRRKKLCHFSPHSQQPGSLGEGSCS